MSFNSGLDIERSYYVATAKPGPRHPILVGEIDADVVVVGGGCTGLSAALHAAEGGLKVVLLEGGRVGWGASGRNGGQMIIGLCKGAAELVKLYGREGARALFDLALEAWTLVMDVIERHAIDCDFRKTGHLIGAVSDGDMARFERELDCLTTVMKYPHMRILSAAEARAAVDTPYHGALFDTLGGHIHPLNYTLGLARAAVAAGVTIHEHSAVRRLNRRSGIRAETALGAVRARNAILAGHALLKDINTRVESRIMPIGSYMVATEPLVNAAEVIPSNAAVSDTRFVVNYYRLSAERRLLFGGGDRYTPSPPPDIERCVRPYLERTFPQLKGRRIDYAWGGLVSVTMSRLPLVGRDGDVYFANGYSGQGVILSTLAGKLLAEAISGETARFALFEGVNPMPFPGGSLMRGPLYVLAMLWYAMHDRLKR